MGVGSASADYWASWYWGGSSPDFPAECLVVGTNILTGGSPYKHQFSDSNSCEATESIEAVLIEYTSDGDVYQYCNTGDHDNYAQCAITESTPTGYYWAWTASISNPSAYYTYDCDNMGDSYPTCFGS